MFDFHIHLARLPQKKQLTQLLLDRNYDFIAVSCEPRISMYFRKKYAVMIDLHIHLARLPNKKQLTQLLLDKNYDFIAIACEPWEWEEVTLLRNRFSTERKPFKTAYGIHPMIAQQANDELFAKLRAILKEDKWAMVGEAGIDKRYPGYDDGSQDQVFLKQAELAL